MHYSCPVLCLGKLWNRCIFLSKARKLFYRDGSSDKYFKIPPIRGFTEQLRRQDLNGEQNMLYPYPDRVNQGIILIPISKNLQIPYPVGALSRFSRRCFFPIPHPDSQNSGYPASGKRPFPPSLASNRKYTSWFGPWSWQVLATRFPSIRGHFRIFHFLLCGVVLFVEYSLTYFTYLGFGWSNVGAKTTPRLYASILFTSSSLDTLEMWQMKGVN